MTHEEDFVRFLRVENQNFIEIRWFSLKLIASSLSNIHAFIKRFFDIIQNFIIKQRVKLKQRLKELVRGFLIQS